MNISQQFAPPFKLVIPYFLLGVFTYLISTFLLFKIDISILHSLNSNIVAWIHLFLLGFVMIIIFGAMAQLVPVVLEVGHFAVDLYYTIYPLLFIGAILMAMGFVYYPSLLPFGGTIAFVSFSIFLFETFLTILKVKKINFVIVSVLLANIFLFFGLIIGIILALGYSGTIDINIYQFLKAHIYLVLVGYVGITIMGMSLILLPMFWLSHGFSWKYIKSSLSILSVGILFVVLSSFSNITFFEYLGYFFTLIALFLYFYQVFIIYKTRVRLENDIYFKSIMFSFLSLLLSLILGIIYIFYPIENIFLTLSWILLGGFITFIITGHLYKIIPFLVWYERFSPYVGKKKIPMLVDIVPKKSANMQFVFSSIGVIFVSLGILNINETIYKSGLSFLSIGAIFLLKDILYMIRFKEDV
ncbi:hypothetical protein CRV07_12450 [Halarcobacter ebronensis]|uniref:Cytochrome C oxidase subunit I n=2 Tax=Halarcobacter ebronensis TaxID=1462615 RepID=A0A4Q1AND6_9BACT|nr:hypothetical protein CRV07_12450 [Halarcobacter ebronensis]